MPTGIYTLISRERLDDVLGTLNLYTELPVELIDENGDVLRSYGERTRYCALLNRHLFTSIECMSMHLNAGKRSLVLGEAYVFSCHVQLNHIAFPLQSQGALLGCIIIGPFLMDVPDSTLVSGIADQYELSPALSLELYDELKGVHIIPPAKVTQLSRLVDNLLKPLLPAERALLMQSQQKLYQQSRINETIQMYKEQSASYAQSYLYQMENELFAKAKTGDVKQAKALLNELLGFVLFSEGGKVDAVRTRAIELTTLLSRVAVEGGANAAAIYQLSTQFHLMINVEHTLDDLCYLLQDVVESFMAAMFSSIDKGNAHIRKTLNIISENYAQQLTLPMVAAQVGLSPNYLSALFQQVMGVSFREHLCRVRVDESKRLLLSTDYPLSSIASAMGFSDQSYYCRVFKRVTGITPGQYRQ